MPLHRGAPVLLLCLRLPSSWFFFELAPAPLTSRDFSGGTLALVTARSILSASSRTTRGASDVAAISVIRHAILVNEAKVVGHCLVVAYLPCSSLRTIAFKHMGSLISV